MLRECLHQSFAIASDGESGAGASIFAHPGEQRRIAGKLFQQICGFGHVTDRHDIAINSMPHDTAGIGVQITGNPAASAS